MIKKRLTVIILMIALLVSFASSSSFACDEEQTKTYVPQVLFGNNALSKSSDEKVQMLMAAVYLCCEQADNQGQDKITYLKSKKVSGVPSLQAINIKNGQLIESSHIVWEADYPTAKKARTNRKKVLRNTVNKVFDFGFVNNVFGSNKGKCDSFAALLYYSHILSDYLADDPTDTKTSVNGKLTESYAGIPYTVVNGNRPSFSVENRDTTLSYITYSRPMDSLNRAGVASGIIGPDIIKTGNRDYIGNIYPSGWNNKTYQDNNVSPQTIYNRSHIIAHQLGGDDAEYNLVTGTDYMNKNGMKKFEDEVADYIRRTGNHVLYRVTPIYKGGNLVCSGVQMEGYSIEDKGAGICFNVFCYNVQPGFKINYLTGETYFGDTIIDSDKKIPFASKAVDNGNGTDLIAEMKKHMEILFEDQNKTETYKNMMREIDEVAREARAVDSQPNCAAEYIELKRLQYEYLNVLKRYVPKLLEKEDFFKKAFK